VTGGIIQDIRDPLGAALQLLTGVLGQFITSARGALDTELTRYLFTTVDPSSPGRALTDNPAIAHLNLGMAVAADALVAAIVVFTSLRSMFEHSLYARYALKVMIPRLLLAIVLVHGSIFFIQMAVDLNNAVGAAALSLGGPVSLDVLPWSASMSNPAVAAMQASQDLFHALFAIAIVVALVLLVLSYVVRTALLEVLIVLAPLAAILMVLPETRRWSHAWLRLFLVALFMQAVQLVILRVATVTGFGSGDSIAESLYALATLWILLKVPGTLHASTFVESKAHGVARHVERSVHRAITPAHHSVHRA
jgi:Conjugal transfer protein TrbL